MAFSQPKLQLLESQSGGKFWEAIRERNGHRHGSHSSTEQGLITQAADSGSWGFSLQKTLRISRHLPGPRGVRPNADGTPELPNEAQKTRWPSSV